MKSLFLLSILLVLSPAAEAASARLVISEKGRTLHSGEIVTIARGSSSLRLVLERKSPAGNTYSYACLVSATVAAESPMLTIQELVEKARDPNRTVVCHVGDFVKSDAPGSFVYEAEEIDTP